MRAPDAPRDPDEIVRDLVELLLKVGLIDLDCQDGPYTLKDLTRAQTVVSVRATIELLRSLDREVAPHNERTPFRGWRQDNRDAFTALRSKVIEVKRELGRIPGTALFLLASGEAEVNSDTVPSTEVQERGMRRLKLIMATLNYMHARCDFILAEDPGEHGNRDYRQRRVAQEAWQLLSQRGRPPKSSAPTGRYCRIATLLWEAMTEERGRDLQWACKAVIAAVRESGRETDPTF
jgi:hypothetical protein